MLQTLMKRVGRGCCSVRGAQRTADSLPQYGVRRLSEAATALSLIQCRPLTPKRRRASLAAALHIQISIILAGFALLAPGCRTSPKQETAATFAPPAPYVRATNSESNVLELQIAESREVLAEPNGSGGGDAGEDFDNLLSMMQGDSFMNIVMQFGLGILASSPKLQAMSKVTLIEVITEMGGDPSRLGAISPQLR